MKKTILFTIIIATLVGCESPAVRRSQLIEQHPEWQAETVKIIREGYLVKGMSSEQVKAAWGGPCWTCTGTLSHKDLDIPRTWEYQTQIVFFDKEGKVTHWTKK